MGQLVVRNLDDHVKERLRRRAKKHGHSMEEEVRAILCSLPEESDEHSVGLGTAIANIFKDADITKPIPELRIRLRPPRFK